MDVNPTQFLFSPGSPLLDVYAVALVFPTGGTVGLGTDGMTWAYSINGPNSFCQPIPVAGATVLKVPGTSITLKLGAGTIATGTTVNFTSSSPVYGAAVIVGVGSATLTPAPSFPHNDMPTVASQTPVV